MDGSEFPPAEAVEHLWQVVAYAQQKPELYPLLDPGPAAEVRVMLIS